MHSPFSNSYRPAISHSYPQPDHHSSSASHKRSASDQQDTQKSRRLDDPRQAMMPVYSDWRRDRRWSPERRAEVLEDGEIDPVHYLSPSARPQADTTQPRARRIRLQANAVFRLDKTSLGYSAILKGRREIATRIEPFLPLYSADALPILPASQALHEALRKIDRMNARPGENLQEAVIEHARARIFLLYHLLVAFAGTRADRIRSQGAAFQILEGKENNQACHHSLLAEITDNALAILKGDFEGQLARIERGTSSLDEKMIRKLGSLGLREEKIEEAFNKVIRREVGDRRAAEDLFKNLASGPWLNKESWLYLLNNHTLVAPWTVNRVDGLLENILRPHAEQWLKLSANNQKNAHEIIKELKQTQDLAFTQVRHTLKQFQARQADLHGEIEKLLRQNPSAWTLKPYEEKQALIDRFIPLLTEFTALADRLHFQVPMVSNTTGAFYYESYGKALRADLILQAHQTFNQQIYAAKIKYEEKKKEICTEIEQLINPLKTEQKILLSEIQHLEIKKSEIIKEKNEFQKQESFLHQDMVLNQADHSLELQAINEEILKYDLELTALASKSAQTAIRLRELNDEIQSHGISQKLKLDVAGYALSKVGYDMVRQLFEYCKETNLAVLKVVSDTHFQQMEDIAVLQSKASMGACDEILGMAPLSSDEVHMAQLQMIARRYQR